MTEPHISEKRRFSAIWIIPIIAAILGVWMVVHTQMTKGPLVSITFSTAEGIEVGKTKIKLRAVELGLVEGIELTGSMDGVTVQARLDQEAQHLLRTDTQFWVVRPQLGPAGISGLGTLLSGAYIEVSPGVGELGARVYRGLDNIPVTPASAEGLHVVLEGESPSTLRVGNPVLYRGYTVGRIESAELNTESGGGRFGVFVEAPYHGLVNVNTRFWDASGISMQMSADGLSVTTQSMEALLLGGVSFDLPKDASAGDPVEPYSRFDLFPNRSSIDTHPFTTHKDYILLLDTSVRGLVVGAPVHYRGIQVGTVQGISFDYVPDQVAFGADGHIRVPVLIRLDPARVNLPDSEEGVAEFARVLEAGVKSGLRASLKNGNLVTGRLFVALDFYDDPAPASIETAGTYEVFPSISSGLEQIEHQISAVLEKLQGLPLENTLASAKGALDEISRTAEAGTAALDELDGILAHESTQTLPADLRRSLSEFENLLGGYGPGSIMYDDLQRMLEELSTSLTAVEQLMQTLNAKPSALLMSSARKFDPVPGAKQP